MFDDLISSKEMPKNDFMINIVNEMVSDASRKVEWPKKFQNKQSGRFFKPHNQEQADWIKNDYPTYLLAKGGEGSGKSVLGIMKIFHKLRRGMSGIVVAPTLPAFKRALWPEFLRWLPIDVVIEPHRRFFSPGWLPHGAFDLVVHNDLGETSTVTFASAENPVTLEGPNVSWAYIEEPRGIKKSDVLEILAGRVRIDGQNGEPPQLFIAGTPKKHWLYDFFGPIQDDDDDERRSFKENSKVITLRTEDNVRAGNIVGNYIEMRGAVLTEAKKRVLLEGEWGEEDNPDWFLDNISMWDSLRENMQSLRKKTDVDSDYSDGLVIGVDAAVSRDNFAIVGVTRHPDNRAKVAVRLVKVWKPSRGNKIDFNEVDNFIREVCKTYNVLTIVYDQHQLHQMMETLNKEGVVWCQSFSQNQKRLIADQTLYDSILRKEITHDGNEELRDHLQNADAQTDGESHKKRIVKRTESKKIDAAVALSMANFECLRLNI